jgi:catechol 2,3-dioxygenase-like lactoylglutathione lyase family enzyme
MIGGVVLPVSDLDASLRLYVDVVGFSEDCRFGQSDDEAGPTRCGPGSEV